MRKRNVIQNLLLESMKIIGAMSVTSTPSSALHTCIGQQKLKVFPANKFFVCDINTRLNQVSSLPPHLKLDSSIQ